LFFSIVFFAHLHVFNFSCHFLLSFFEALLFVLLPCANSMSSHLLSLYEFYVLFCVNYLSKHKFFCSTLAFGIILFLYSKCWIGCHWFPLLVFCVHLSMMVFILIFGFFVYKRGISFSIFVRMLFKLFDF